MTKWEIDPKHSEIHFRAKHMLISTVTGLFTKFEGTVDTLEPNDFVQASIHLSIDVDSVYTNESYRDEHLKSSAFFDVDKHPYITFRSTELSKDDDNASTFVLRGMLDIKDMVKEVQFHVSFGGTAEENGRLKAGFQVSGIINRKHFGLTYNPLMEAGGMVVSEEIELAANIELIKIS
ncbi:MULTISPECIES: YceI family protein [Olivibacter]|jgi:polyisoprenoid-binding protein YceI|uniref:YceI family protein n=3 Tax=Sphingobacteriaceae TaxID=84566 RepID=F4C7X0_SPHS2|nr:MULTISPECIES: YceI family protein [Olivibacter]MDM8174343.1 YceI family protein [Olivibacter sp. 47]MDX3916808.1 YceI family protein [Pseudosphingobacterium sp.]QEL04157.1 YceI family protein [Olivibacter sp. LS-1]